MPDLPCSYPECRYSTGELATNAAAAALNNHTAMHAHMQSAIAPAKVEKVPRPTITTNFTTEQWTYFLSRWNAYKSATQIKGQELITQLLACCSAPLRYDLYRTCGTQINDNEENIITAIRKLAVQEENIMVARVTLSKIRQDEA